jgi:hypothetical protein
VGPALGSQFDLKDSGIFSVDGKDYPVLSVLLKDGTTNDRWTKMEDARTLFKDGRGKWNLESSSVAGPADSLPRSNDASPSALLNPAPTDSTAAGPFGSGGRFSRGSAISSRPLYESRLFVPETAASPDAHTSDRVLRGRAVSKTGTSVFDTGAQPYRLFRAARRSLPASRNHSTIASAIGLRLRRTLHKPILRKSVC